MTKTIKERIRRIAKKLFLVNKLGGKCSECGDTRFYVLHFHHTREDKTFNVCSHRSGRMSELMPESNKCILLCANCHQKHHTKTMRIKTSRNTTKKTCLKYLNTTCCERCGENNDRILNFHHTTNKEFLITNAINNITTFHIDDLTDDLKLELDKCIVLCPNCHMEEHYDLEFYKKYEDEIIYKTNNLKEIQKPLDRNVVKEMYENGMKQIDIARYFSASKGTICDILKQFGYTKPASEILVNKKELIDLNKAGKTNKEISKELKCSKTCVQKVLSKNDLEYNKDKNPDKCKHLRKFDPTPEELYKLLETNSYADLGRLYNVSRIAVFNRKRKFDKMKDDNTK